MARKVMVLVGTVKGAFFFESDENRRDWCMTGPHLHGWEVYSLRGDARGGRQRLLAGTSHFVYGPTIRYSDDLGDTWTQVVEGPKYGEESGFKLNRIWQIVQGAASEPNTLYAGVDVAGLFVSRDAGLSWSEVSGLTQHPSRPKWFPGNGGLCCHTILVHPTNPKRIWVGISAVGCLRTDDGGATWKMCNEGLPTVVTDELPEEIRNFMKGMEEMMEISRCVHKMMLDPANPDTLYMQFHGGVLKSTNAGDSWQRIESGLPGNFGFPMGISSRGDLYIVPLEEQSRTAFDGNLRVYRSTDHGESWHAVGAGLPDAPQYVGVLRDALDVDPLDPAGIYFGTTSGEVFYSADSGDRWGRLPGQFPRITTIKTWVREA